MKKSLKTIFPMIILLVLIGTSFYVRPAFSQSATVVKVETSTGSPAIGQPFIVTISIDNVENLYGLEIILSWDSFVLQATMVDTRVGVESHADGVLHESSNSPSIFIGENNLLQSQGEYRLVVTSTSPAAPFSGSGNIVKVTFNPISIGSSALGLESQLSDYPLTDLDPSQAINHNTQSSSVTVVAGGNNTPSNTPTTSQPASSSTPTAEPTSQTPIQTSKQQEKDKWEREIILALAVIILVLAIAISSFIINRRKRVL